MLQEALNETHHQTAVSQSHVILELMGSIIDGKCKIRLNELTDALAMEYAECFFEEPPKISVLMALEMLRAAGHLVFEKDRFYNPMLTFGEGAAYYCANNC